MPSDKSVGLGSFPLEYAALGMLFDEPKHGYRLYREFGREFRLIWKAGQATFYATLTSLEHSGHVAVSVELHEGRPPRKVYRITDTGRARFLKWLRTPVRSMRAFRVEFMARLRFFALLGLPGAAALIQREIDIFRQLLAEWEKLPTPDADADPLPAMVTDFRRRQAQAIIDWLLAWQTHFTEDTRPG